MLSGIAALGIAQLAGRNDPDDGDVDGDADEH